MAYQQGNYQFVVGNHYKPFTMQEMLTPFSAYGEAYNRAELAYDTLTDRAGKFKYLSETLPEGSKARSIYENYANYLNEQANDFVTNGLNLDNGAALDSLKRRYSGEIGRLDRADALKQQQMKEQQAILAQDPTRMFSRDAASTSIDEYLDKDSMPYSNYSGQMLAAQAGQAAAALANSLSNGVKTGKIDDYTNMLIKQYGLTRDEVASFIADPTSKNANPVLKAIEDNVLNSSRIPEWGDASTVSRARSYIAQGLWNAIGKTEITPFDNYGARKALDLETQKEAMRYQQQLQGGLPSEHAPMNPMPMRDKQEVDEENKEIQKYIDKGYFTQRANGQWIMTQKGLEAYREGKRNMGYSPKQIEELVKKGEISERQAIAMQKSNYYYRSDFSDFIDNTLGAGKYIKPKPYGNYLGYQPGNIGNAFARYKESRDSGSYDTYRSTYFEEQISSQEGKDIARQIITHADRDGLKEVEFKKNSDGNGNPGFKKVDKLDKEDLKGYNVTSLQYSKYGIVAVMAKEDSNGAITGDTKQILLPTVNKTAQEGVLAEARNAELYSRILNQKGTPMTPKVDSNGKIKLNSKGDIVYTNIPLSKEDYIHIDDALTNAQDMMSLYSGQIFYNTKTEDNSKKPLRLP